MTPAQRFATILTESPVDKINFMFGSVHVSPDQFGKVAEALRSGKITVVESKSDSVADAEYKADKNRFVIPTYNEGDYVHIADKALIVHEAVHGIIDVNRWKATQLSGEAAGYLAQVLYRLLSGDQLRLWAKQNAASDPMAAIYQRSLSVIDTLGLQWACGLVSARDCAALRNLVHQHPSYKDVDLAAMHPASGI